MLPKKYYFNEAIIDSSKKALEELIEVNEEMLQGLTALDVITEKINTPVNRQVVEDARNMFICAHRMLTLELANVHHLEMVQQARKDAEERFSSIEEKVRMSNQAQSATA